MEGDQPSPSPSPNPSTLLRDISNFRTPKHSSQNPTFNSPFPHFFTASKQTPSSSSSAFRRRTSIAPSSRSKAARKLKAFELEQYQSSLKAQILKEKSLKCLAKSLSAWLNFLLENPKSCGCDLSALNGAARVEIEATVFANGKRDSWPGVDIGIDGAWRAPKRQRDKSWQAAHFANAEPSLSLSAFSSLEISMREVCSFEDLTQRMRAYLSLGSCKEVLSVISQVAKNIDEGRFKMKAHCPIVTDVGMKKKATRVLMTYNPIWLRIGLYIIFGGESFFPSVDVNSDQEVLFLKMVVEKQFFSHAGLARAYAYNKLVEGLYRPGYFEVLGNVILKRFLLLVLILDRAKSQSSLPINYGIDGTDGGSPLLFISQSDIKSSRQVIHDFLSSEVMHGEGNVLAHLVIIGYKVHYQQYTLLEYDFTVKELFEDLQDGIRLCRAIQLLQHDASILMKMAVPSDTRKKNLANCQLAMQYLKQAAVPLYDEDGEMILAEDVVNGDKELTLSLLWNIFVHLQLPLLINKTLLLEEISKVKGANMDHSKGKTSNLMEMLLEWIQVICQKYDVKVDSFASLVDGKAMWCLIDYYFHKELCCSYFHKGVQDANYEESILLSADNTDAIHNFILSQKLTSILGNFPEVLQMSDILEHHGPCNEHSVIVLLVFLSSQLIGRKNMDILNLHKLLGCNCQSPHKKRLSLEKCLLNSEKPVKENGSDEYRDAVKTVRAIKAWWEDMAKRNNSCVHKPSASNVRGHVDSNQFSDIQRERAAKIIQSYLRGSIECHKFLKIKSASSLLQTVILAWLKVKQMGTFKKASSSVIVLQSFGLQEHSHTFQRYFKFLVDRHSFIRLRKSALIIQQAARAWIKRRHQSESMFNVESKLMDGKLIVKDLQIDAEDNIQVAWRELAMHTSFSNQCIAATIIQSHWRGWFMRKNFLHQRRALIEIRSMIRSLKCQMVFQQCTLRSAIIIQSCIRGWVARREANRVRHQIVVIQSHWRSWMARKDFLNQKNAIIKIQNDLRCVKCWKTFQSYRHAAIEIQRFVRGQVDRRSLVGASCLNSVRGYCCIDEISRDFIQSPELKVLLYSVLKLQRWWKSFLWMKSRTRAVIVIQLHIRQWIAKQVARRKWHCIVVIQSHWRSWLVRKDFLNQKNAIIKIQNGLRCVKCRKAFQSYGHAAMEIQRFVRGQIDRRRLLGASCLHSFRRRCCIDEISRDFIQGPELKVLLYSVLKLQRWWKSVLWMKSRTRAVTVIQSHIRQWIAKQVARKEQHRVVVIQSYWKGYLARKESKEQVQDLRIRVQKSAANVDDSMRLINRLVAALSELLNMRSVSSILHICSTLDVATTHSQNCCEKLVSAGAIDTLLKLIRSVSRSIPDQEVLKYALSTLRNLAHYPHLADVLIHTHGSVEIFLWELLRNKEEGFFIASELLKKLCSTQKGYDAVHRLPLLLKRLYSLAEDLKRKANNDKRNGRPLALRDSTERRLREVEELLKLITTA
ncbi:abnormal spindle-like microcephaly-associated protein homolog isoform X1 [Telopea speciosissima]|uniref:abnormal spindle-like microcephaly-associated protein homolog isoform X1 n=1 Tax=Telopea speciosissima TaxID=54955 RepID=UPI001CC50FFA|nr:abnormal spindle-like microcephaly-associated protein homolog isoform X1 [Telopea speciosissima]